MVEQERKMNLPGMWYPKVIDGLGQKARYQEGDMILMVYINSITHPLTQPHAQIAFVPRKSGGRKPPQWKSWLQMQCEREQMWQNWQQFVNQLVQWKWVHVATDRGVTRERDRQDWGHLSDRTGRSPGCINKYIYLARPPGVAGYTEANACATWMYGHYDNTTNNMMELRVTVEALRVLPERRHVEMKYE
jgi:ribonuclease HI